MSSVALMFIVAFSTYKAPPSPDFIAELFVNVSFVEVTTALPRALMAPPWALLSLITELPS